VAVRLLTGTPHPLATVGNVSTLLQGVVFSVLDALPEAMPHVPVALCVRKPYSRTPAFVRHGL
jgi:hypothetical protein